MQILLLGANGQLGQELLSSLPLIGDVVPATRHGDADSHFAKADLGVEGEAGSLIRTVNADVVVNAAAYTAVDKAEDEPRLAERINHYAVGEIAEACAATGSALVHISTDYVFDGLSDQPYQPEDSTRPLGVYGSSKWRGEQAIRLTGCNHVILRTAWAYGLRGNNFLTTMLRLSEKRAELGVVDDQIGSPTPTWWIAKMISEIAHKGVSGAATHHLVTRGQVSWHGFATAIFEEAVSRGLMASSPKINPISSKEYPTAAQRPPFSVLDSGTLQAAYDISPPYWRIALRDTFDRGGAST